MRCEQDAPPDHIWLSNRLKATEEMIESFEAAIVAVSGGAQSYTLNTGQTTQTVTKANIGSLRIQMGELESRREHYRNKLYRLSSANVIPGF